MGGIDDRVEGFDAGGVDYLVKPFAFAELLARVAALGRRPPLADSFLVVRVADLEIDCAKLKVTRTRDPAAAARVPAARISHAA